MVITLTPTQIKQARTGQLELTTEQITAIRGDRSPGRRPITDRCPCGAMSRKRAITRSHQCGDEAVCLKCGSGAIDITTLGSRYRRWLCQQCQRQWQGQPKPDSDNARSPNTAAP